MEYSQATHTFEQWLVQSGYQVSPKAKVTDLRHRSEGRGLVAQDDILEDEVLFTIPRNVLLNVDTGTLAQLPGNKEKLMAKYDHWEGLILTILFELSLGAESKWAPYFNVFPHEFHNLMFWTDEELESLNPSLVLDRIGKDQAEETYKRLIPAALHDLGIQLDVSLAKFHHVASTILSYSFDVERPDFDEDEEDDEEVQKDGYFKSLVALADTLNADTKRCNANLVYETEFLVMKAIKPITKGEQIYNTYGDLPNSELLRRYGYVEYEGSKFDFGEVPLTTIKEVVVEQFALDPLFVERTLDLISQSEVDEIEENIVLDAYDTYIDGEVIPEAQILLQVLTIIGQVAKIEKLDTLIDSELLKHINRTLKKCYQLIEAGSITKQAALAWELCISSRLAHYPSHAFRDLILPAPSEQLHKVKMSECILKSEVSALQSCSKFELKLIDDEKLIRNILKRKAETKATGPTKKQRV